MKGIVLDCLQDLVLENFGPAKWQQALQRAGQHPNQTFAHADDVSDESVMAVFTATCQLTDMSFEQTCDAYGYYWVSAYMPKHYPEFYEGVSSTKQMLLKLDEIHSTMQRRLAHALPPRHTYDWTNPDTLVMGYSSRRPLMRLFLGSIHGVARHFGDRVDARVLDEQHAEVIFSGGCGNQ